MTMAVGAHDQNHETFVRRGRGRPADPDFWSCGHPKTDLNTHGNCCRKCHNRRGHEYYQSGRGKLAYKKRSLPGQIERLEERLARMKAEAVALGLEIRP